MELILIILVGVLYTAGFYMILRRSFVKVIMGLILLGHAVNLLIFTVGKVSKGIPAFVNNNNIDMADPLPQALILTAIVIGFGLQAFTIVLFKRAYQAAGTDDLDSLKEVDE